MHGFPKKAQTNTATPRDQRAFLTKVSEPIIAPPEDLSNVQLTKGQLEALHKLLLQQTSPSTGNVAVQGSALNTSVAVNFKKGMWFLDSGASDHMTGDSSLFNSYAPCHNLPRVRIADGSYSPVAGLGSVKLSPTVTLKYVLHVPKLSCNLLSISKLTRDNHCVANFFFNMCLIQQLPSGRMIGNAELIDGLYVWRDGDSKNKQTTAFSVSSNNDVLLWHKRLGHPNFRYLKHLLPHLFINKRVESFHCEACQMSKHTKGSYPFKACVMSQPFSLIHSDIWGPRRVPNISNSRWFITFIDDHTRVCWVYLLKEKSETPRVFINFHAMIKNQFQTSVHTFRTDNGREYFNTVLGQYLATNGIIHQSSCADSPQQNGDSERKNRHLLEVARSIMYSMYGEKPS